MAKIIVTHIRPDLDACAAVWLLRRFMPEFKDAATAFVSAGHTYNEMIADTDLNIIHVDTGKGMFDHHHLNTRSSSAKRITEYLIDKQLVPANQKEALIRLAEVITMIDNFEEAALPNPESDFYDMALHQLITGYEYYERSDEAVVEFASQALDAFFQVMRHKVEAEKELKKGIIFQVRNLKGLGLETRNEEATHLAQKTGYDIVIRKDPKTGRGRIKVRPLTPITLEKVYEKVISRDRRDQWFYHVSGKMLLNGSTRNQSLEPTKLTLAELIDIVKSALS